MSTNSSDVILAHIENNQRSLFTSIPAIVSDVSKLGSNKISVQPALQEELPDGKNKDITILVDMPIQWPSGGGAVMTFPIKVGDSVLVVFSMRSISDFQVSTGGTVAPFDDRLHNLSDGYVIPGIFKDIDQPSPNASAVEIKFSGGSITINPDGTQAGTCTETWSMTNGTGELIDLLVQTLTEISNSTVNTMLGPQPLINKVAIQTLITDVDSFKE